MMVLTARPPGPRPATAEELVPAQPRASTTPPLPVRDLVDMRLADLLARPGCPACRGRSAAEERFLDAWLYERVNDVRTRQELDVSRGLCEPHIHALLAADRERAGGALGTAILYDAMLRVRLHELTVAHAARGRGRGKRLADAAAPPGCLVCREAATGERTVLEGLIGHLADAAWAEATASAPLCLPHLRDLMVAGSGDARWAPIEARQLARLHDLQRRLQGFAHHASHDRRHLRTPEEEASVDEAAALLGRDRRPGGPGPGAPRRG